MKKGRFPFSTALTCLLGTWATALAQEPTAIRADPADVGTIDGIVGDTGRGINGLHLVHDGERWWITHATWDNETAERPIPAEYLPDGQRRSG